MNAAPPNFDSVTEGSSDKKEPITWIQGYSQIAGKELDYDIVLVRLYTDYIGSEADKGDFD